MYSTQSKLSYDVLFNVFLWHPFLFASRLSFNGESQFEHFRRRLSAANSFSHENIIITIVIRTVIPLSVSHSAVVGQGVSIRANNNKFKTHLIWQRNEYIIYFSCHSPVRSYRMSAAQQSQPRQMHIQLWASRLDMKRVFCVSHARQRRFVVTMRSAIRTALYMPKSKNQMKWDIRRQQQQNNMNKTQKRHGKHCLAAEHSASKSSRLHNAYNL